MKLSSYIPVAALLTAAVFAGCQDDLENVENRIFDEAAVTPSTVLIDGQADNSVQSFTINMANPVSESVTVTYAVDMSLLDAYRATYEPEAVALPAENYSFTQPKATFLPGSVTSSKVEVTVTDLLTLDRDKIYVLPVTVKDSPIPVLESQRTRFIVVRGAALVNVAANMVQNNASLINPGQATGLNNLSELTAQMIVNVDEFGGSDSNIQTLLGIEGNFLLRISDSGVDADQIQLATNSGNSTDPSWKLKAQTWTCITFTFNSATGEATMYFDGVKKATCISSRRTAVDFGTGSFYIGKSWNDNRWLNGAICEVRIWNRILSDAEIAGDIQPYVVPADSEGLQAYWKFNEGAGMLIHDYANGYDLNCVTAPKWINISLPE